MWDFVKHKTGWIILALAVLGAGWWFWGGEETPLVTVAVTRGDAAETVSASSTLVADTPIDLDFERTGRVRSIAVREGAAVSAGETLAILESGELDQAVAKAKAALDQALAAAGLSDEALREARQSEDDAEDYLEAVEASENQKVEAADVAFENAEDYEDDAESYYNQVVTEEGASSATAKSARLTLTAATNARKAAEEAKESARKARDAAVRLAEADFHRNREKVETLESRAQALSDDSAVSAARADYLAALERQSEATLTAPANGTVTKINYEIGEVVGSAAVEPFGRLLSADLLLEARVSESDIAGIRAGQTARVSFDALPSDERLEASVLAVEPEATVVQDVVFYRVTLRLAQPDQRLKPGMSADADFLVAEKRDALLLPARLIRSEGGRKLVTVVTAEGDKEERVITTGLESDDGQVEITDGLSEGERVLDAGALN